MTPLERARSIPRPFRVAGVAVLAVVAVLVVLSQCTGSDPDDPTTLQVEVVRVTTDALPDGYCAEQCNRWMAFPPFWYEVIASDAEVAELRAGGWTVNAVPADPTAVQDLDEGSSSAGLFSVLPWWLYVLVPVLIVGVVMLKRPLSNGRPG